MRHARKIVALLPVLAVMTAAPAAVLPGGTSAAAAVVPAGQAYTPASRVLRTGDTGRDVRRLQERLAQLRYYPGAINGRFGAATLEAVWAFQEVQGLPVSGRVYRSTERALVSPRGPRPLIRHGAASRVEVSLARHVLFVWRAHRIELISHISSGGGYFYCGAYSCGYAITPTGNFRAIRRIHGWHRSELGLMYNPVYFHRGFAIHGDSYVPVAPVSHGCVRVPMAVARVFPSLVPNGTRIYVRD